MTTRIKLRRDTAANWLASNPILAAGEPGLETDTGKIKYGDGVTAYALLPHAGGDLLSSETAITVQTGDAQRWLTRLRREDADGINSSTGVFVNNVYYDNEGNVIVTAGVDLDSDSTAVFKFTSTGDVVWKKIIGGYTSGLNAQGAMSVDSNNDIWLTVYPGDPGAGLVKLSGADGSVLYTNTFWSDDTPGAQAFAIAINSQDDLILSGSIGGNIDPPVISVMKVVGTGVNTGDITWQKQVLPEGIWSEGAGLAVDYNDDIIVTGTTNNGDDVDKMFVITFDTNGNAGWQKSISLGPNESGAGSSVVVDSVGTIYVTGTLLVKNPVADMGPYAAKKSNAIFIISLDASGTVNWARRVGPGACSWVGAGVAVGDDGDLYLVGSTVQYRPNGTDNNLYGVYDPAVILARYDKLNGEVVWQRYWNNVEAQDIPAGNVGTGEDFNNSFTWAGNGIDVQNGKVVIGGSTRMGPSDMDQAWGSSINNFSQGFVAQFDTDASEFSQDGYKLTASRVPGKLVTDEIYTVSEELTVQNSNNYADNVLTGLVTIPASIGVRKNATSTNTWTFERNGDFSAPADGSIKLNQTQLGFANMYGWWANNDDNVWYQSVVRDAEGYIYTVGSNDYDDNTPYVTKFAPTGEKVWEYEIRTGTNAQFYISWNNGEYTVEYIDNQGSNYRVGDKITLGGAMLGGNWSNNLILNVDTIYEAGDGIGSVATVSIVSGTAADGSGSNYVSDYYGDGEGDVVGITIDPKTKNLVVALTIPTWNGNTMDSEWSQTELFFIDSASGALISNTNLADEGDIYVNEVTVDSLGNPVAVGEKYNEYLTLGNVAVVGGSGIDNLRVAKADITAEHFPGDGTLSYYDCWLTGTNITDQVQLSDVNYYRGLTTVTRQGSGATFDITANGAGQYTAALGASGGTNYLVGHKIKVLGTDLGGATPDNDAVITVDAVDAGAITNFSISGTSTGSATFTALSGSNYNVGNGAVMEIRFDPTDGSYNGSWNYSSYGQNYVIGDQVTIAGTQFAGGTSPANDIVFTVSGNYNTNNGLNDINNITGNIPTTYLLLNTNNTVDFSAGNGYYTLKQNLGGEAFVWTRDWAKAIGGPSGDKFYSACTDSNNNIIAVGSGRYDVNYDQALVVKYNSSGAIQWSVAVNPTNDYLYNHSVGILSDDTIVVAGRGYDANSGNDKIVVTKLSAAGAIVWQNGFYMPDDGYPENPSLAVDAETDEIVVTFEAYSDDNRLDGNNAWHIIKLDSDGEVLWKRIWGTMGNDTYQRYNSDTGRSISVSQGKFTIVGHTYATVDDYYNACSATLPLDGTGTGQHGIWTYFEPTDSMIQQGRLSTTAQAFTPTVNTSTITTTDDDKYYYTGYPYGQFNLFTDAIRNEEGGGIEFADGSKQTFSATTIPQVRIYGEYYLRPEDSGRHLYLTEENYTVYIPYWERVKLPVGYTITIINRSGSTMYLYLQDGDESGRMFISGGDTNTMGIYINDNGSGQMVTLIKIEEGDKVDDADSHGDRWMVAGADIGNDW